MVFLIHKTENVRTTTLRSVDNCSYKYQILRVSACISILVSVNRHENHLPYEAYFIVICGLSCCAILGAFPKLQKATISFVMSVRLSAWNNSAPTGRIFMKYGIWVVFETLSGKFKFHSNRTRTTAHYVKTNMKFWSIIFQFFVEWEMFHTIMAEKIKTPVLWSVNFFFENCCSFDNVDKYCRAGKNTDDNMAHAHCMPDT